MDLPQDAVKRAWDDAIARPSEPVTAAGDPRVVELPGGVGLNVAIDERDDGRFARVSLAGGDLELARAVLELAGIREFPVHEVQGADAETRHFVVDLEGYKAARAMDHIAHTVAITGAPRDDAEIAAIQFACRLPELAAAWQLDEVRRFDDRELTRLSDRFLVPRGWIEFQVQFFLAELEDGLIGEDGKPRQPS